jgi:hypothetical protein
VNIGPARPPRPANLAAPAPKKPVGRANLLKIGTTLSAGTNAVNRSAGTDGILDAFAPG